MNNCFSIYYTSWITSGPKSNFICDNIPTKVTLFLIGCSEVNSTWLITSELANQRARKVLFTCVVYTNEHYSPPTEWIIRKPNKNKMAGVNEWIERSIESIFNGFLLKMLLRSLPVYILKQLFFSVSMNSGRIFTSPLRGSVNILPLFTSISKNNC